MAMAQDGTEVLPTIPRRRRPKLIIVVMIGRTGAGKSTLGNVLLGYPPSDGPFPVSSGAESCTDRVTVFDGCFLGMENRRIRVVDTPGLADTKDRDDEFRMELVERLQRLRRIHVILWVRNAQDRRIDVNEKKSIQIVGELFGNCVLENSLLCFTNYSFDRRSVMLRQQEGRSLDSLALAFWKELLSSNTDSESFYSVDDLPEMEQMPLSALDARHITSDPEETRIFYEQAEKMWQVFDLNYTRPVRELKYLFGRLDEIRARYEEYKQTMILKDQELAKLKEELARIQKNLGDPTLANELEIVGSFSSETLNNIEVGRSKEGVLIEVDDESTSKLKSGGEKSKPSLQRSETVPARGNPIPVGKGLVEKRRSEIMKRTGSLQASERPQGLQKILSEGDKQRNLEARPGSPVPIISPSASLKRLPSTPEEKEAAAKNMEKRASSDSVDRDKDRESSLPRSQSDSFIPSAPELEVPKASEGAASQKGTVESTHAQQGHQPPPEKNGLSSSLKEDPSSSVKGVRRQPEADKLPPATNPSLKGKIPNEIPPGSPSSKQSSPSTNPAPLMLQVTPVPAIRGQPNIGTNKRTMPGNDSVSKIETERARELAKRIQRMEDERRKGEQAQEELLNDLKDLEENERRVKQTKRGFFGKLKRFFVGEKKSKT